MADVSTMHHPNSPDLTGLYRDCVTALTYEVFGRRLFHSMFHRFIAGNDAHIQKPDDTNIRHEEDKRRQKMYRENDKNTENTKHAVKQPRQKMNVHAHLHNLKRLYQSITTRTPACRIGFPSIIHKSIKTRQTSQK